MQERGKDSIRVLPRSCKYALSSYVFERGGEEKNRIFSGNITCPFRYHVNLFKIPVALNAESAVANSDYFSNFPTQNICTFNAHVIDLSIRNRP